MIFKETKLFVSDNSGVNRVKCINCLKFLQGPINSGKFFLGTVNKKFTRKINLKKKLMLSLLIGTKSFYIRKNGIQFRFDTNRSLIFHDKDRLIGNRIYGPLSKEIRALGISPVLKIKRYFF